MDGRVAIVTGSGTGIGASAARLLAESGHAIVLVARREAELRAVADEIEAAGGTAFPFPADLGDVEAADRIVAAVEERFGRVDVIVNNAAAFRLKAFEEFLPEDLDELLAVNVRAPYLLVQRALPLLRRSPAASVVNVSSAAAVMFRPRQSVYGLSKAALEHLTKQLAQELAPDGIRVNCVRPGPTLTPIHTNVEDPEQRVKLLAAAVPLGRAGQPEEIAWWIARLADAEAAFVTGAIISVDGGRTLGPPGVI